MLHILLASLSVLAAPSPQQNVPIMYEDSVICSAVLLDSTHVLTAAHCIQESTTMDLMCGSMMTPGLVIRFDKSIDLAEFELVEPCNQPVSPVAKTNPARGDKVYTLGCPAGICGRITVGVVSGYASIHEHQVLSTDATAFFGNSGGGLFNDSGEVVGICSTVEPHSANGIQVLFTQYIPASTILRFLESKPIY